MNGETLDAGHACGRVAQKWIVAAIRPRGARSGRFGANVVPTSAHVLRAGSGGASFEMAAVGRPDLDSSRPCAAGAIWPGLFANV